MNTPQLTCRRGRAILQLALAAALPLMLFTTGLAHRLLLYHSDGSFVANAVKTNLVSTGLFTSAEIDILQMPSSPPSLSFLLQYHCVYAWTNSSPPNPVAQGNRLKQYVDAGGRVALYTYALSPPSRPWELQGGIMGPGYNPLTLSNQSLFFFGNRQLDFSTAQTGSPLLTGVTNFSYGGNTNYSRVVLDPGAILVGSDLTGEPIIAVNSAGNVVGINVYPGTAFFKSPGVYRAMANACKAGILAPNRPPAVTCPTPSNFECDGNSSATVNLTASVSDPDGDSLTVRWIIDGTVESSQTVVGGGPANVSFSRVYPVGTATVVTVDVSDGRVSDSCSTTVTVVDTGFPTIMCASDVTVPTDPGRCDAILALDDPVVSDNCEVVGLANDAPAGSLFPLGTTSVTWTVTDIGGNSASCVQLVTVVDEEAPLLTCPADLVIGHDAGACEATGVDLGSASASDNCDLPLITNNAPDSFPVGTTVVFWTATDASGNFSTCVQLVTVTNEDPVADAGEDFSVECDDAGDGTIGDGTTVNLNGLASFDPDAGDVLSYQWDAVGIVFDDDTSAMPTGQFPLGSTTVNLTVTDQCGASDTIDVIVVVQDTTSPQIQAALVDTKVLWPPNHEMIPIAVELLVSDACTAPGDLIVSCGVSSDEPDDGLGDGSFTGDVDGEDGHTGPVDVALTYNATSGKWEGAFELRAERSGGGDGRKYSIECFAMDGSWNVTQATACVTVPHSQKGGKK